MGRKCIIKTCNNSETKKQQKLLQHVRFHTFSKNSTRRDNWVVSIQALANQFGIISKGSIICSDHFEESSYVNKPNGTRMLSDTAVPTLFPTVSQGISDIEMISIDCDSNKETYGDNSQQSCDNVILSESESESEHKPNFQNQENVRIDEGNLQQRCDNVIPTKLVCRPITCLQSGSTKVNSSKSWHTPISEENDINNPEPISQNEVTHQLKLPRRIRYPGDIIDVQSMSRKELENSVMLCKKKVESQNKMLAALKRKVKEKDHQISRLRCLVKASK